MADREVPLRRALEQAEHCIAEARSILANKEDPRWAKSDVLQARQLLQDVVLPGIEQQIAGDKLWAEACSESRSQHT